MRLLFADPAMAQPIRTLKDAARCHKLAGTWLWGSMAVCNSCFDATADLYSLSFIFAEIWLVAEGAAVPAFEVIRMLKLDQDRTEGVQLMRHLILEVLKAHRYGNTIRGTIQPRVDRHLPVSWLGAWALLLGFQDLKEPHHVGVLPCLRPSEEDMLDVFQCWARIAAAAEDLPGDLTGERAQSVACAPLISDMCALLARLCDLSHLDDREQEDAALVWAAANFMHQDHPLVTAMKAQGAAGFGMPEPARNIKQGWLQAVQNARRAVSANQQSMLKQQQQQHDLAALQKLKTVALQGGVFDANVVQAAQYLLPPPNLACLLAAAASSGTIPALAAAAAAPPAAVPQGAPQDVATFGRLNTTSWKDGSSPAPGCAINSPIIRDGPEGAKSRQHGEPAQAGMEEAPPADARRGGQEEVNGGGAGRQDGHVEETADDLVAVGNGQYCRRSVLVQVQAMWEHPVAKNVPIHQLEDENMLKCNFWP
ncbi:expressed protein [Chlorella variabilis]|uniref:Expressed protein n=1 Tax=Chlorella variabilis TaxID=554065 RepID=E1Z3A6_CHLVA|nr:expressed protein [Chlorella variabilis]EFN60138.1 expressed protein [Chlorella variabilis]|eukprot:XP_005852240.1 expressed protein [Chlorella variabilis]